MKIVAGRLTDEDRAIIFESNARGRRVLVAALTAHVEWMQGGGPREDKDAQMVGVVADWDHDSLWLGSWSFRTRIAWADVAGVWWRDEAPPEATVALLIATVDDS